MGNFHQPVHFNAGELSLASFQSWTTRCAAAYFLWLFPEYDPALSVARTYGYVGDTH